LQASAGSTAFSFLSTSTPGINTWQSEGFNFTAAGPTTLLSFLGTVGVQYIGLDNISVTDLGGPEPTDSGVPEPATWATMLFGFGLIGAAMRKRGSQQSQVRYNFALTLDME
jgi:hypothetical protein